MNQQLLIGYEPTLIHFGSDILKIVAVLVLCDTTFTIVVFLIEGQLWPPITLPKTHSTPLWHTRYHLKYTIHLQKKIEQIASELRSGAEFT